MTPTPVHRSGPFRTHVLLPYLLIGLVQGLALWWLHEPTSTAPSAVWRAAMTYLALALPLAWYLGDDAPTAGRARWCGALALGALFSLLGAHAGAGSARFPFAGMDWILASAVLGFVLATLVASRESGRWRLPYHRLFAFAWRNALAVPLAAALTAVFWTLLWAAAWLMESIGLTGVRRLITTQPFLFTVTASAFGVGMGAVLGRADTLPAVRRFWLALNTWFLPPALAFAAVWLVALAFVGVQPLFATRSAASYLFWFCALCVLFANAAFQDGEDQASLPPWLARTCGIAWLAVPVLALLGDWALWLRVQQHGWTSERLWAGLVGLVLSLHALGYAVSVPLQRGWLRTLPATNIVVALVLAAGLLALLSPLSDARRLAVNSQLSRLLEGKVTVDSFDWRYLRQEQPYGPAALARLADQKPADKRLEPVAARAATERAIAAQESGSHHRTDAAQRAALLAHIPVLPTGRSADPAWLAMVSDSADAGGEWLCWRTPADCLLWLVDLDGDGAEEALLIRGRDGGGSATTPVYYRQQAGQWQRMGWGAVDGPGLSLAAWRQAIESRAYRAVPPRLPDLLIGDTRVRAP